MMQQRDIRRAQEEVLEDEFQRRKAEEAVRLAKEVIFFVVPPHLLKQKTRIKTVGHLG